MSLKLSLSLSNLFNTTLKDIKNVASDINKDDVVDKKDLLAVQSHVFGYSKIKQE